MTLLITPGSEIRVNTTTANDQGASFVTALSDGGYVVTWMSLSQDGSGWGVYAQRYDATGSTVGSETRINTWRANDQEFPTVAALSDGGYVVTWMSRSQDDLSVGSFSGWGIYAQRYDATGNTVGSETRVNTTTFDHQFYPSVAAMSDGGYVVTWTSHSQDGSGHGIYAQRYDATGNTIGSETRVNTTTASEQYAPTVAALPDGGYVVTWGSLSQDGSGWGVYAQRYDATDNPVGSETRVNTTTAGGDIPRQAIAVLSDGGYVVTWGSLSDSSSWDVHAQRYDASGNTVGSETRVNTTTADQQLYPSVAALSDGGYVVTWMSVSQDGSGVGIYAQQYDQLGNAVGGEIPVNTTTAGDQFWPYVTALSDGGYVVTWTSDSQDGSGWGVYSRVFAFTAGNEPPSITSDGGDTTAAVSVAENTTAVTTVVATDPDAGQTLSFSKAGGADADLFTINPTTGVLAFVTTPDFEAPTDAGGNNVYDVTVQVSDGNGGTDTQDIAVTIQNVPGTTITGTNQAQTLTGTGEEDSLSGLGGNDTLQGLAGPDVLSGGAGTDTASYSASGAGVAVSLATGTPSGGDAQGDTLLSIENVSGSDYNDTLEGDGGNNVLSGETGIDTVSYEHTAAGVKVSLAVTAAQNTGGAGSDKLSSFENLAGSTFNDALTGSSTANALMGLDGNDRLIGGGGADTLTGGPGADTFVFTALTDSPVSTPDIITDFLHGVDVFDFSAVDAHSSIKKDQAFAFAGEASNVIANSVTWYESGGYTIIQADVNGNTTADLQIMLLGIDLNLHATDFIL